MPSDIELESDLNDLIEKYFLLTTKELTGSDVQKEEDETGYEENLQLLREHKSYDRNRKLAVKVKETQGYICKCCGFNFEEYFGELGTGYIEAHHLTPLSELRGKKVTFNPSKDFSVLCANCHRMIHKSEYVGDVRSFKERHLKKSVGN